MLPEKYTGRKGFELSGRVRQVWLNSLPVTTCSTAENLFLAKIFKYVLSMCKVTLSGSLVLQPSISFRKFIF
jgi:hypothetical protein